MDARSAEGWYRDPYAIHEDRWMSDGQPTKLVRDSGTESFDPPPDLPLPGELVPVSTDEEASGYGADLRRADTSGETGYDAGRAGRAALDAVAGGGMVDEPGGDW